MIAESEGEFSVFDFDVEDPLQSRPKSRPIDPRKRSHSWTFQDTWTWSTDLLPTMRLETFEERKASVIKEFKSRLLGNLGIKLQSATHFLSMACNFECLHELKTKYDVPIQCYMQGHQQSKFALDQRFQPNAD